MGGRVSNRRGVFSGPIRVALLSAGVTTLASAQRPNVPEVTQVCARCSVAVQRVATIGGINSALRGQPRAMVRTGRGDFILLEPVPGRILVFDSAGNSRGFLAGRGQGPGELTRPQRITIGAGDTLLVYEADKVSLFGPTLTFVRSIRLTAPVGGLGSFARLENGLLATRPNGGRPGDSTYLTMRRADGSVLGQALPTAIGGLPSASPRPRHVAGRTSTGVGLWIVWAHWNSNGYRVSWADTTLRMTEAFERKPDWWHYGVRPFATTHTVRGGQVIIDPPLGTPVPRQPTDVRDARQASRGHLLFLIAQPLREWPRVTNDELWWRGYSAVVEVIDPRTNRLVGSSTTPGLPLLLVDDEHFVTYRDDADGAPYLDVWRITIAQGPEGAA